ncbi:penicillin-binding transpeptidase domain-containing protein [Anaerosphaera multitolerans]|uniref:PASTA domain-containing protein n=1 Tax=Anaerosphaera multitolerans TaxID=2487351 RepID=A0A437S6W3_9FIRM|nr:penicillin-binding transpeptidase domain-containing protein [Anaerosphaera multitolerans]RVU54780.1 PASTA domain-containing protein [Anaerosphaera multitolerans]
MNKRNFIEKPKRKNSVKKKNFLNIANSKVFIIFFLLAFLFALIIIKLFMINFVEGEELTRQALNQLSKSETVKADRGIIYDRNKKELAINVTKSNLYYDMTYDKNKYDNNKNKFNEEVESDAKVIASVLEKDVEDVLKYMVGNKTVKIASNVTREKGNELRSLGMNRLSVEDVTKRLYPYDSLACHVIGFTNDEGTGQYGIESKYDEELSGIPGKNISLKSNAQNQIPLTDEESYAPKEGVYPVLTLDENIQQFAEDAALKSRLEHNAEMVSVIVQDTQTGEILAMANNEGYDLNNPKDPVGEENIQNWDNYSEEEKLEHWYKNWSNFCVNSQYEPGSTFKLITAAAALEEAKTDLEKTYLCNGVYTEIPSAPITCTSDNRGQRSLEQAMAESCNISFVRIGNDLGAENMLKYIKAFGFGERTGIDLPAEAKGEIPKDVKDITPVKLSRLSYGHAIAVTPIQLINSVSAIVNGGYLNTPRMVDRIEDSNGNVIEEFETERKRRVISEENSEIMKDLMRKVVEEGTGRRAKVEGYQVGGKTGTANAVLETGGYDPNNYISSFVGVAPMNDPKVTVLVIVQKPKGEFFGSTVAVPAAQSVLKNTLEYLNIPKTEEVKVEDEELIEVPNVSNLLLPEAGKTLVDLGLQFNVKSKNITDNAVVIGQKPAAGNYVKKESIVDLEISNNESKTKVMPSLYGVSEKDLQPILENLGIDYTIKGGGHVVSQSIYPGEKIDNDSFLTLEMSVDESDIKKESKEDSKGNDIKNSKSSKAAKNKDSNKKTEN